MNKYTELILTLIFLTLGGTLLYFAWGDFITVLKGLIGPVLLLVGIIFLLITVEDFKQ